MYVLEASKPFIKLLKHTSGVKNKKGTKIGAFSAIKSIFNTGTPPSQQWELNLKKNNEVTSA